MGILIVLLTLLAVGILTLWRLGSGPRNAGQPVAGSTVSANGDSVAVVDAETLRLGERVIRLSGIVAPPRGDACRHANQDCATAAAHALAGMIGRQSVSCALTGTESMQRPFGRCSAGTTVLNDALVSEGWAHAAKGQAHLGELETRAREAGRGLWRSGDW